MSEANSASGGTPSLKELFGRTIELEGEDGASVLWTLLAELQVEGRSYAVLQSDAMRKDGDIEIFRVVYDGANAPQLESVEDDEEWENVSEAYDDLPFGSDDRP